MRFRSGAAALLTIVLGLLSSGVSAFGQDAAPAANDELLGFSRYLPADTRGYISALQMGKLRSDLATSNAWSRVAEIPEIKQALDQFDKQLQSNEIPPPARAGIDLLKAAGESEVSLAVAGDSSHDILNLAKVVLTSFAVMAPSPHAPDSLEGKTLETKRGPLRAEWTGSIPKVRLPSFAIAARIKNTAKHKAFVEAMLDLGWQAASNEIERKAAPRMREPLLKAYEIVKIGNTTMRRFRLRLGDVVPLEGIYEGVDRLPIDDDEKKLIALAISNLSVDAHLGFLGEYLTLTIGADDRFITQIVERFEGREKDTLAASERFAAMRSEVAPSSLGIVYADNTNLQTELQRSILPLINRLADPELHSLLGAPPEITMGVQRMQFAFESAILATPLRQETVIKIDRGIKQYLRTEFDRQPAVVPTTPLATLAMIPEQAIGYSVLRNGSLENLFEQLKYLIAQQRAQLDSTRKLVGVETGAYRSQVKLIDALVATIDEKFIPSLQGEMGVVMGGFTDFGLKEGMGPPIRGIPIPTLAMLVHSAEPDKAIDGVSRIFQTIVDIAKAERAGGEIPVKFVKHDLDGIETWIFKGDVMAVDGIEPHFAKVGGALVFSTSFELTKKMRDTAKGTSPAVTAAAAHQALKELLPVGAEQASYLNGTELNRNLRSTSAAVFGLMEKNPELFNIRERELEQLPKVKQAVDLGLTLAGCLRGSAASLVSEGQFDVLREWINIEDLKAK